MIHPSSRSHSLVDLLLGNSMLGSATSYASLALRAVRLSPRLRTFSGRPPTPRVMPQAKQEPSAAAAAPRPPPTLYQRTKDRGPVSWTSLFLVTVAAGSAVAYYRIERERRLERAMGQVVSSESGGWTPRPDVLAKRKFVQTQYGWFPMEDGFGARELAV